MRALAPRLVVGIGNMVHVADLAAAGCPTLALPLTFTLPIGGAHGVLGDLDGRLGSWERPDLAGFPLPVIHRFGGHFALKPPAAPLTRAALGLPDNAFVFVAIGSRLAREIDPAYEAVLARILDAAPGSWLLCVNLAGHAFATPALRDHPRIRLAPATEERAVYPVCDAYLNPPRVGGATSAFHALHDGLPVVTFPDGDVARLVQQPRTSADPDAYVAQAVALATDPATLARARADIRDNLLPALTDRDAIVRDLATLIDLARAEFDRRQTEAAHQPPIPPGDRRGS